jgi:hypothetical protein
VVIHQLFESNTPQWQKVFTIVVLRVIDLKNYVLKRKLYKEYTTKGNLCLHICNLRVPHLQIVYTIVNLWVLDLSHVPLQLYKYIVIVNKREVFYCETECHWPRSHINSSWDQVYLTLATIQHYNTFIYTTFK